MFCPNCGNHVSDDSQFCPNCGMQFQRQPQQQAQPRTRLGITVGMLGAVIWFSCLVDPVIPVLLAAYVLFVEKDKWLKGTAIKAVAFYFGFFFLGQVIDGMNLVFTSFNSFINYWFHAGWYIGFPAMLSNLIRLGRMIFFLVSGFSAFKMKGVQIRKIDEFVETHL